MSIGRAERQMPGRLTGRVPFFVVMPIAVVAMAAAAIAILRIGAARLAGANPGAGPGGEHQTVPDPTGKFLLAVAVVVVATHGLGRLARRLGQPPVVGEIVAGILLGPSLLASVSPHVYEYLFPPTILAALNQAAQLGLVAFMFLVGWEVDLRGLWHDNRVVITISYASLTVPFLGGLALALALYGNYAPPGVRSTSFVLFVGLALAITAMPVLARVLHDNGLMGTRVGGLAMASASVEDGAAWTLLAVAVAVSSVATDLPPWLILALAVAFAVVMLTVVRPLLPRAMERLGRGAAAETTLLPLVLVGAIGSAVITQLIGIHAIFGAFLFGLILPRGTPAAEVVTTRVRGFTMAVLLPLYFAVAGIHTSIGSLGRDWHAWLQPAVILLVAVATKLVGAGLAARIAGLSWREARTIGVLMNCRGLTEIVIATVGLQLGIIDGRLFTTLVLIAVVTTALTGPLLRLTSRTAATKPVAIEG